jgi:hypothetical protein
LLRAYVANLPNLRKIKGMNILILESIKCGNTRKGSSDFIILTHSETIGKSMFGGKREG